MKSYNLSDIFKFAINMEDQGEVFYENVSLYAKDKSSKNLFSYLQKQEMEHSRTFKRLSDSYAKKRIFFNVDTEFDEVIDTLLRGLLLPDISEVRDVLRKDRKDGLVSIIKIAMEIELNTIIFYKKLKEILKPKILKTVLDKIISQEESHLVKLKNVRLDLDPLYAGLKYGKFF